jgi:copper chaperone CopZ
MAEKIASEAAETASCCGSCGGSADQPQTKGDGVREAFHVTGMTCAHCVSSVSAELNKVDGVTGVVVDLESGRVTVESTLPLTDAAVAAAVEEAGYEFAGRSAG